MCFYLFYFTQRPKFPKSQEQRITHPANKGKEWRPKQSRKMDWHRMWSKEVESLMGILTSVVEQRNGGMHLTWQCFVGQEGWEKCPITSGANSSLLQEMANGIRSFSGGLDISQPPHQTYFSPEGFPISETLPLHLIQRPAFCQQCSVEIDANAEIF